MRLKQLAKRSFRSLGVEVGKYKKRTTPLVTLDFDLLLDVGANKGQYALNARAAGFSKRIVSFEPLSAAHAILTTMAKSDDAWQIHERTAIGSRNGEAEINIAGNSYSSSLLPMLPAVTAAQPNTAYVGKEVTKVSTLDSVFEKYRVGQERVYLKIDAQGYEKHVLEGAEDCLSSIDGVEIELALVPQYGSQELYEYFFSYFKQAGFELWSISPGFSNQQTGRLMEFDAVFIRS